MSAFWSIPAVSKKETNLKKKATGTCIIWQETEYILSRYIQFDAQLTKKHIWNKHIKLITLAYQTSPRSLSLYMDFENE